MNKVTKEDVILITGAGGGLGSALKFALSNYGYKKVLTPNRSEMDLLLKESVQGYFARNKPKAVFHLASLVFGLLGNLENQFKSVVENTLINSNLMEAISESGVEYVFFAGTVASYPFPYVSMPLNEKEFFNGLPHGGEFGYAMAKRHAYTYLKILKESKGINYTYGIFTNLYGENDKFDTHSGHVIPSLVAKGHQALVNGHDLEVWGDGHAKRDFLHFYDAARAAVHAMEQELDDLLNISSGRGIEIREVANCVANAFKVAPRFLTDKPVGIPIRCVDNTKLKKSGFEETVDIEAGIHALCGWYQNNLSNVRV